MQRIRRQFALPFITSLVLLQFVPLILQLCYVPVALWLYAVTGTTLTMDRCEDDALQRHSLHELKIVRGPDKGITRELHIAQSFPQKSISLSTVLELGSRAMAVFLVLQLPR